MVVDGQHRLEAARRLGIDVYFVVEKPGVDPITLHGDIRVWTPKDYIRTHAESGLAAYKRLQEVCAEYSISPTAGITILSDLAYGGTTSQYTLRQGALTLSETSASRDVLKILATISGKLLRGIYAVVNLKRLAECPGFNVDRMLYQLAAYPSLLHRCATLEQWADQLGIVYDYRRQDRREYRAKLVELARDASKKHSRWKKDTGAK